MTGTVVEVEIPADEFALRDTLAENEGLQFEIERVVAHEEDRVMPFVWVSGEGVEDAESILRDDPSVETLESLADLGEEQLFQMEWVDQIEALVHVIVEEEGTVLSAAGQDDEWHLRILFPDRDALSETHEYCKEHGISWTVKSVYQLEDGRQGRYGLTDEQQNTLTLAFDEGYYEVPREATADDLAEKLGVSHQAISERLRRGHGSLVKNAIVIGDDADTKQ